MLRQVPLWVRLGLLAFILIICGVFLAPLIPLAELALVVKWILVVVGIVLAVYAAYLVLFTPGRRHYTDTSDDYPR